MERELWRSLYSITARLDNPWGKWRYSAGDILVVYFWAVVCDRPTCWAADKANWPDDLRLPSLPSQPTLSRRLRRPETEQLMTEIENTWLALACVGQWWIHVIDGKSLAVSGVSKDADASYGRGAGGKHRGYKLHTIWAGGPLPITWALAPIHVSEKTVARLLIPGLPGSGYLLGDPEFDSNALFELAHAHGHELITPKRQKHRGLGHRPQSAYRLRSIELTKKKFGKALYRFRRQIERDYGNLTSFGGGLTCLPPWVRRFPRVRNWVQAKLLVNAARWFRRHGTYACS